MHDSLPVADAAIRPHQSPAEEGGCPGKQVEAGLVPLRGYPLQMQHPGNAGTGPEGLNVYARPALTPGRRPHMCDAHKHERRTYGYVRAHFGSLIPARHNGSVFRNQRPDAFERQFGLQVFRQLVVLLQKRPYHIPRIPQPDLEEQPS